MGCTLCLPLARKIKWYSFTISSSEIKIVPVYIAQEKITVDAFSGLDVEKVKQYITDSLSQMKKVLIDLKENKADIKLCPKTTDSWRCERCRFKEICS